MQVDFVCIHAKTAALLNRRGISLAAAALAAFVQPDYKTATNKYARYTQAGTMTPA